MAISTIDVSAQQMPVLTGLPELPDKKGFAGMYAGVSHGNLFCMGGANFPEKMPWEGGTKKWYDGIYMLQQGKKWVKLKQRLPQPAGYGVSVSYKGEIIIAGGCNEEKHFNSVIGYTWTGEDLQCREYPSLPVPMAYMAGMLVGNSIVIAGGNEAPGRSPLRRCFVLDLQKIQQGWVEIDPWPGPERAFPVCAVSGNAFYLFSGETTVVNAVGDTIPLILQDAYRLTLGVTDGKLQGKWHPLAPMPRGMSAAAGPLPVLKNGTILCWGGVDAISRLHRNPAVFPGISEEILSYDPSGDVWSYCGRELSIPARVTLPVVMWNDQWIFISGEVKPGVRTKLVTGFKNY